MTNRVEKFLEFVNNGEYKKQRKDGRADIDMNMDSFSLMQQNAQFLKRMLQREEPLFYENDIFGFNRTYGKADYYAEKYVENDKNLSGPLGNVTVDYANILKIGLPGIEEKIRKYKENAPKEKAAALDILRPLDYTKNTKGATGKRAVPLRIAKRSNRNLGRLGGYFFLLLT